MTRECRPDQLLLLIENDLPESESSQLLGHLERCEGCQRDLDELSADDTWWMRASRGLAGVTLDEHGQIRDGQDWSERFTALLIEESHVDEAATMRHSPAEEVSNELDPPAHPEMLGRVDEFDIEECIGQGGMGIVFRGFDRSLNRPVAIKILAPHLSANADARQRFAREAQAAAAVVHPHVIPIYRVSSSPERPYIAMSLINGPSLQQHVAAYGALETVEVVRVAIQIAQGLDAAHRQGLIHRDIKPANVLMENDVSRVVISDFGLARAIDDVAMTQSGCLAGTPHYMSPEQILGDDFDHRSDLFSLGSLMYFLATGKEPFSADNAFAVINKIVSDRPEPACKVNPQLPTTLSQIIDRLLEKRPDCRIQSANEVQQLLTSYLAHLQDPQHHAVPYVRPVRRQHPVAKRWAYWLCAIVFMCLIGFGTFQLIGGINNGGSKQFDHVDQHNAGQHHELQHHEGQSHEGHDGEHGHGSNHD